MSALTVALLAAQAELPTALRRDAAGEGYRYMTLDALIAATRPTLNKHGLTITQWPTTIERGEHLVPGLLTRIDHIESDLDDGALVSVMPLYLTDKTMQSLGAAITYARRYAWASALGIAAEEDNDAAPMPEEDIPF